MALEFKAFDKATFWDRESQRGQTRLLMDHRFGNNGPYSSQLEYGFYGDDWKWQFGRELREISPGLFFRVRSEQDNRDYPFSGQSDKIGEVIYNFNF